MRMQGTNYWRVNMSVDLIGHWHVRLYGAPGELKEEKFGKNIITEGGKSFLASFLAEATTSAKTFTALYIGVGTDSTTEATSNTILGTEVARQTGTASNSANAIYEVTATMASGVGTGAIVEYGLFDSNTAGIMFSRDTEAVVNKGANDTLTVTTKVTIS